MGWIMKALGWAKALIVPLWGKVALYGGIALALAGTVGVVLSRSKQAGRDEVIRENQEDVIRIQDAQKDAIANRPHDRSELQRRLRDGDF